MLALYFAMTNNFCVIMLFEYLVIWTLNLMQNILNGFDRKLALGS